VILGLEIVRMAMILSSYEQNIMKDHEGTRVRVSDISLRHVCASMYMYWHFPGYIIRDECELKIK
jgi:hypothetical protein